MPHVYLLRCADDSLYCGWTTDLDRRLAAHGAGTASRYTRSRLPVELAAAIPVADRSAALREEARIKRLPRAAKLRLVKPPNSLWPCIARSTDRARPAPAGRAAQRRHEHRHTQSTWHLATGTLACPGCDAPVLPSPDGMSPRDLISCGFCGELGA